MAPPPPPPPIEINDFTLEHAAGVLQIVSDSDQTGPGTMTLNGTDYEMYFENGRASVDWETTRKGGLILASTSGGAHHMYHVSLIQSGNGSRVKHIPLWLSLIPPLVAIVLALLFKEVIISLFLGVWSGAFIAGGLRFESFGYYFKSIWDVVETYVIGALNNSDHLAVIIFSLMIGGMVAVISRNGGMKGVVTSLSKYATTAKSSQFVTWLLGVAIFFDDYANTLIVGNTMRSVTDKFRISREKLAYIVDSTAAPVSAIAFITTWIGAELGYIGDGISGLDNFPGSTPYAIFISSLKYSFYPILTLIFMLLLIRSNKDYGPMLAAEKRARSTGEVSRKVGELTNDGELEDLEPVKGAPLKWTNAFIPVMAVILMTIFGLLVTGFDGTYQTLLADGIKATSMSWGDTWSAMNQDPVTSGNFFMKLGVLIGNSNSYSALIWASLTGLILALLLTLKDRIMKLTDAMNTMVAGFKTMLPALIILTLAWSLAITTDQLNTATFLSSSLQDSLNPYVMPILVFILAAMIAFSTGSSWSTMAILYPIAIPTTWAICMAQGLEPGISMEILLNVIAVVLAASVLGDHCSPISDTTILSSLASECNHIDHVRTQLPYALTVGVFSITCNGLATLLGGGWLISFILLVSAVVLLWFLINRLGENVD
ncbi:MAG: Na+/H+ antiporter NhaC family protein [Saprospiraceae bacterium]|nr:Na+/H+ antiporter NhaC family protein [Saprospiraceae bacterium]